MVINFVKYKNLKELFKLKKYDLAKLFCKKYKINYYKIKRKWSV